MGELFGTRLREARLARGLSQAGLARRAGISASYLNLIEHNRRRIAGRLLLNLAQLLDLDPDVLRAESGGAVAQRAATAAAREGIGADQAALLAARFPDWARVIARQADRIDALQTQLSTMTDRLGHDPALAQARHDVISAVTSIRATAAILLESEGLDAQWQKRFHGNLHQEALRLAERSAALMARLDAPEDPAQGAPSDLAEAFLIRTGPHRPELEKGGDMAGLMRDLPAPVRHLVEHRLAVYAADARRLPLAPFVDAVRAQGYDPVSLALHFDAPVAAVLRRLAALPEAQGHPEFGLMIVDGAGAIVQRQPIDNVVLARGGAGCPLWPVYVALGRPGQVVELTVTMPGADPPSFAAWAIAGPRPWPGMAQVPVFESTMLLRRAAPSEGAVPVGAGCRLCPREACALRRAPPILGVDQP